MFQEMIGIFKTCKMLEYPVGNTRPKAWKNMLINYIQHFYLYIGRNQKSGRNYWKPPRTSGHLIQNACKPEKGLLVSQLRLHPLDKLPHGFIFSQTRNGLNTLALISECRTVTAIPVITPGNHGSIFHNRSKGQRRGLNLLHTLELISNCRTVTAIPCMTPGNDGSI